MPKVYLSVGVVAAAVAAAAPVHAQTAASAWHQLVADTCFRRVADVNQLAKQVEFCKQAPALVVTPANQQQISDAVAAIGVDPKVAQAAVSAAAAAGPAGANSDTAVALAAATEADNKADQIPTVPLSLNWSLTVDTYVGLLRVIFGSKALGTTDRFASLSGVGGGVKVRYSRFVPATQKTTEVLGLGVGLYYEPDLKTASMTDPTATTSAQALSAMIMTSTFHYLYAGAGWKFASSEPGYEHGLGQAGNWMFVFGVGFDGKSL